MWDSFKQWLSKLLDSMLGYIGWHTVSLKPENTGTNTMACLSIKISDHKLARSIPLGEGGQAIVYLQSVDSTSMKTQIAMKKFKKPRNFFHEKAIFQAIQKDERQASHPNIIYLMGHHDKAAVLVFPVASTNLKIWIEKEWSWNMVLRFAKQMVSALGFLHACKLAHGDLKPDNCLLMQSDPNYPQKMDLKLADFGAAVKGALKLERSIATVNYAAKARFRQNGDLIHFAEPTSKTDVYSCGTIFWQMFTKHRQPYERESFQDIARQKMKESDEYNPSVFSDEPETKNNPWTQIIKACWATEDDREPIKDIGNRINNIQDLQNPNFTTRLISPSAIDEKKCVLETSIMPRQVI